MKRYENKINVIGTLIKNYREKNKLSKSELSRRLELHAVYIDRSELYRMEEGKMIIKSKWQPTISLNKIFEHLLGYLMK